MNLIEELSHYCNQSEERGNKVIAIDGVRAIIHRHAPDSVGGSYSLPNAREDEIIRKNMERAYRATAGLKRRGG